MADDAAPDAVRLVVLPGECLDFSNSRDVVVQGCVELSQLNLTLAKGRSHVTGESLHGQDDQWDRDHAQQGQLPAHVDQHRGDTDEHERIDHDIRYGVGDQLLE